MTHAIDGLRAVLVRGAGLSDGGLQLDLAYLVGVAILFVVLAGATIRREIASDPWRVPAVAPARAGHASGSPASAREAFGEQGFDGATIRGIATRAGVDPALVHHYFGTKQRLFLSVMSLPFDAAALRPQLLAHGRTGVGERLVRFFLGLWDEQPSVRPILTGIVRSAMTRPDAAVLLRDFLGRQGLFRLVAAIAPDRPTSGRCSSARI